MDADMAGADGSGGRHHDCRRCHRLRLPRFRCSFGMRRSRKTGSRAVKIRIFMERRVSESVCAFLYLRTFYLSLTVNPLPRRRPIRRPAPEAAQTAGVRLRSGSASCAKNSRRSAGKAADRPPSLSVNVRTSVEKHNIILYHTMCSVSMIFLKYFIKIAF